MDRRVSHPHPFSTFLKIVLTVATHSYLRDEEVKRNARLAAEQIEAYHNSQPASLPSENNHFQSASSQAQFSTGQSANPYHTPTGYGNTQAPEAPNMRATYGNTNSNAPTAPEPFNYQNWPAPPHIPQPTNDYGYNQRSRNEDQNTDKPRSHGKKSGQNNHGNNNGKGKKKSGGGSAWSDGPIDEFGRYRGVMKPCTYHASGKCTKGSSCTYSHDL